MADKKDNDDYKKNEGVKAPEAAKTPGSSSNTYSFYGRDTNPSPQDVARRIGLAVPDSTGARQ